MDWQKVICKILSGRLFLVVVIGLTYGYMAINQILDESRINEITLIVIYSYFTKKRENEL